MHSTANHKAPIPIVGDIGVADNTHTRQTIDRLLCIRKHLKNPQTFRCTAGELLDWCSDLRAFQNQFHQYLMGCLMEVNDVAGKPGFDLELCFRLLTVCNKQRDMFPQNSASMINIWTHSVCKLMDLQRQHPQYQSMNSYPDNFHTQPRNVMNEKLAYTQKRHCTGPPNQWGQVAQIDIPPTQQPSLSVITTVWGMSKTQTPPIHSQSSATSFPQPHIEVNAHSTFQQPTSGNSNILGNNQSRLGPMMIQNPTLGNEQSPTAAAAAAMAAVAAATATATATATFIKGRQEQDNINSFKPMYNLNEMNNNVPISIIPTRHPYPRNNTHQIQHSNHNMNQTGNFAPRFQQQYSQSPAYQTGQVGFPKKLSHRNSSQFGNSVQYESTPRPQSCQNSYQHSNNFGTVGSSSTPHSESFGQNFHLNHPKEGPFLNAPSQDFSRHHFNEVQHDNTEYQHGHIVNQIPGNPTPPLTPATSHHDYKALNYGREDYRLTFPVRDGVVLKPFRLQHNIPISNHAFFLRQNVYEKLYERPDLDLQFKCYHHDDLMKQTNWPDSVQVNVNDTCLTIPRGTNKFSHKPLYFKNVCKPGRNSIDISVSACCCSHFFVLQMVHRPSIRFVVESLTLKSVMPESYCIKQICENLKNGSMTESKSQNIGNPSNLSAVVSLRCPITYKKIKIPARGEGCKHIQCFDLEAYLQLNSLNPTWRCPVCHKNSILEYLIVDQFMQNIVKSCNDPNRYLVSIDSNCKWELLPTSNKDYHSKSRKGVQNNDFLVKEEKFSPNESTANQEHYISALSVKRNYKIPQDVVIKRDPDVPANKRFRDETSPGFNLNNLPAPSPGSYANSLVYNKSETPSYKEGFPHSYINPDHKPHFSPTECSENADNIARRDSVPIERRINHHSHPRLTSSMSNGGPVSNFEIPNHNPLARSTSCNANFSKINNFHQSQNDEFGSDILDSILDNDYMSNNMTSSCQSFTEPCKSFQHRSANENPVTEFLDDPNSNIPDDILSMFDSKT